MSQLGLLITNTGTPDQPDTASVRRYLREFLSDKRIVQLPRLVWLPILYGLVLPFRPARSAKLYQCIWTSKGSPMRVYMESIREKLSTALNIPVEIGMNYGNPSIQHGLQKLKEKAVEEILVLPLFPQYSYTTTASTYDRVEAVTEKWDNAPILTEITHYAAYPAYINALAASVKHAWQQQNRQDHLLISFHGIPERFVKKGDPYQSQCEQTASMLAHALNLKPSEWTLCYQSQFGYDKWLKPQTQALLNELPQKGIKDISIICPGFPVDCLETLEEIAVAGKKQFQQAGGQHLLYIPALNDSDAHISVITNMITSGFYNQF